MRVALELLADAVAFVLVVAAVLAFIVMVEAASLR